MKVSEYAYHLLSHGTLSDKLLCSSKVTEFDHDFTVKLFDYPVREAKLSFSEKQIKFPKKNSFVNERERGKALHFFANHELLAIEMMAQALLMFPKLGKTSQKLLLKTISEEQDHLNLYLDRMKELNITFGDFPLNSFFWSYMKKIKSPEEFFSVMSLTFEQANLDFCLFYKELFEKFNDEKSAKILDTIYLDEIKHVARGKREVQERIFLKDNEDDEQKEDALWSYYLSALPYPLTPARAKGIGFDREGRKKTGLSDEFINKLEHYCDEFNITKRKAWSRR